MKTEASSTPPSTTRPPHWLGAWLAFLPASLVLGVLGVSGLGSLKRLPAVARWFLAFYTATQFVPALLAPDPVFALLGAAIRTALMAGLIGIGALLATERALAPMGLGLMAVYLTTIYSAVTLGQDIYLTRLTHPYMTSTTLGLAGALGIWLGLFSSRERGLTHTDEVASRPWLRLSPWLSHPLWRTALGLSGSLIILASGSRGALLAAAVGVAAGALRGRSRLGMGVLTLLAALGVGAVWLGERFGISALARFSDTASSGRDLIWATTSEVVRAYPASGVGSYGLGRYLQLPQTCQLWTDANGLGTACPPFIANLTERLGSVWLIAHNGFLQPLAETGPLGVAGLMALLGFIVYAAWKSHQPLILAIVAGLLVGNVTDNLVLVPSPFFAELFWVAAGIALVRGVGADFKPLYAGLAGAGIAAALAFPVWGPTSAPGVAAPKLLFIDAPNTVLPGQDYAMTLQLAGDDGDYRAVLSNCQEVCTPVASQALKIRSGQTDLVDFKATLRNASQQRLKLSIYTGEAGTKAPLLAERTWEVRRK